MCAVVVLTLGDDWWDLPHPRTVVVYDVHPLKQNTHINPHVRNIPRIEEYTLLSTSLSLLPKYYDG